MQNLDQFRAYPVQLGHLAADPLIDLWIDPDRLAAFLAGELAILDPYSAQVAEAEERFLRRVHSVLAQSYDTTQ